MGAPLGNQNAAKGKQWAAAIERALERIASGKERPTDVSKKMAGVDMAADAFVRKMFQDADLGYFKELGDRLDGKPHQTIAAEVDTNVTVEVVRFGTGKTAK